MTRVDANWLHGVLNRLAADGLIRWEARPLGIYRIGLLTDQGLIVNWNAKETAMWAQGVSYGLVVAPVQAPPSAPVVPEPSTAVAEHPPVDRERLSAMLDVLGDKGLVDGIQFDSGPDPWGVSCDVSFAVSRDRYAELEWREAAQWVDGATAALSAVELAFPGLLAEGCLFDPELYPQYFRPASGTDPGL